MDELIRKIIELVATDPESLRGLGLSDGLVAQLQTELAQEGVFQDLGELSDDLVARLQGELRVDLSGAIAEDVEKNIPVRGSGTDFGRGKRGETGRSEAERVRLVQEGLVAQANSQEVTPEQQEALEATPDEEKGDIFTKMQAASADAAMVLPEGYLASIGVMPGSVDLTDEAVVNEIFDRLGYIYGDDETWDPSIHSLLDKKTMIVGLQGTEDLEQVLKGWARDEGKYTPEVLIDGVKREEIDVFLGEGMTEGTAWMLGRIAQQSQVDARFLAEAWKARYGTRELAVSAATDAAHRGNDSPTGTGSLAAGAFGGASRFAQKVQAALDQNDGSRVLAVVALHDKDLARRLREDPYQLNADELRKVGELTQDITTFEGDPQKGWIAERLAGGLTMTIRTDSGAVEEAVRTLATTWNMNADAAAVSRIAQRIIGEDISAQRATLANPFNPSLGDPVQIRDTPSSPQEMLRQTPEYDYLFAHKGESESEEAYASRFSGKSQSLLGEQDQRSVRVGMASGDSNAVGQNILMTGRGLTSSPFQARLAQLAETFRTFT